ncbi:MAG: carboxynorspermidine decarboxylase [Candidatus Omnitrophica bacterium]|nr:carboxynorspermidine decarboxylase [Candidatus Omnitrophota bacterium]
MKLKTPYYLIDEKKLLKNLKIIKYIRDYCGAKSVLALKCFSTWGVFKLMKKYMDGTTASSPYEARLGYEKFGKEVHAYSVGYSKEDIKEVGKIADTVIFNSVSQLKTFYSSVRTCKVGLRINPRVSYSHFDLADPARRYSRLGVVDKNSLSKVMHLISGVMFHFNCENDDLKTFSKHLDYITEQYESILKRLEWVSLGGGLYFTKADYPVKKFCRKLKEFSDRFKLQIYLEPGESAITQSAELVTTVLDIVKNQIDIAIVDASTEAHMLDLLIYRSQAKIREAGGGKYRYMIAGRSCLAGDIFGTYRFPSKLKTGSIIRFSDAAGYTMVKKNWFNGLKMPAIVVKRLNGKIDVVRKFEYKDFMTNLS